MRGGNQRTRPAIPRSNLNGAMGTTGRWGRRGTAPGVTMSWIVCTGVLPKGGALNFLKTSRRRGLQERIKEECGVEFYPK